MLLLLLLRNYYYSVRTKRCRSRECKEEQTEQRAFFDEKFIIQHEHGLCRIKVNEIQTRTRIHEHTQCAHNDSTRNSTILRSKMRNNVGCMALRQNKESRKERHGLDSPFTMKCNNKFSIYTNREQLNCLLLLLATTT